jgi:cyanate permease
MNAETEIFMLIRFSPMKLDPKIAVEAVVGLSVGNIVSLPPLVIQHEFAARSFGLLVGLNATVGTMIMAAGPGLFGLAHDLSGSYATSLPMHRAAISEFRN